MSSWRLWGEMNLSAAALSELIGWFRVFFLPMSAKMGMFAVE